MSARIDGFSLWFRVPAGLGVSKMGDPFLAVALLPAMLRGEAIVVDPGLPVSARLLKSIRRIEDIFHCWNRELKIVPVSATPAAAGKVNAGGASFFSGGVDSAYTFLKRADDIDYAIFIQGFDFYAGQAGPPKMTIDHIADLSQLAYKLAFSPDPFSSRIRAGFAADTLQALKGYDPRTSDPAAIEEIILRELNTVISGPAIFESRLFPHFALRPTTRSLLPGASHGGDSGVLNRRLLEDAYRIEISRTDEGIYEQAVERNRRFTASFGKKLVSVETNAFPFGYRYNLSRNMSHGAVLGAVALLLGFDRVYVPGSAAYDEMVPLGSHPLADPLWSNEAVEVIHDGADVKRVEKLEFVAGCRPVLENLRVCFNDMNVNCGACGKCLRTMIGLELMDVRDGPFPTLPPLAKLGEKLLNDENEPFFLRENQAYALAKGKKRMADELGALIGRYDRRMSIRHLDAAFFGGRFRSFRMRSRRGRPRFRRINLDYYSY